MSTKVKRAVLVLLLLVCAALIGVMVTASTSKADEPLRVKVAAVSCTSNHWSSDYRYYERTIMLNTHTWRVMHELHYRHCWNSRGLHWADPLRSVIGCRQVEADDSALRDVTFNLRMWDRDGHEVNPRAYKVECNRESWTEREIWYLQETRLHRCANGGPRWDSSVKLDLVLETDGHVRLSGAFWGYFGPTRVTC